jgi:predicted alpha/beta hydrolase family esterase
LSHQGIHMTANVLILPGLGDSGPRHWQTRWEKANPTYRRVVQTDWDLPLCGEWVLTLDAAIAAAGPDTVLVAHSIACLAVVKWAATTPRPLRGALLVAPPDPDGAEFPMEAAGFRHLPRSKLPFASILVASSDDLFATMAFSKRCAKNWGSAFVDIGKAGHINADSRIGDWPEGLALLQSLLDQ